jgi:hypothetical protein
MTHFYIVTFVSDNGGEMTMEFDAPETMAECVDLVAHGGKLARVIEVDGDKLWDATARVVESIVESHLSGDWRGSLSDYLAPHLLDNAESELEEMNSEADAWEAHRRSFSRPSM